VITAESLSPVDVVAIATARDKWLRGINSDDLVGILAPLADDFIGFPPNAAAFVGRDEYRTWHLARIDNFHTELTLRPAEVVGSGRWAFERSTYSMRLTPRAGGEAIVTEGPCIWIWRRRLIDQQWQVARAIWNANGPAAAASPGQDVAELKQLAARYQAACDTGNIDALIAMSSADIALFAPGAPAVQGGVAVRDRLRTSLFDPFRVHLAWLLDEIHVAGDLAVATGAFTVDLIPKPGGNATACVGKFMAAFMRPPDEGWQVARIMFTTDRAAC